MKGRTPTQAQKQFWNALCTHVGCIACREEGRPNFNVSIHHIDGRTKPWAHWLVLPLCAGHHQDGTGVRGLLPVHPYVARFEAKYGRQPDLLRRCLELLEAQGLEVPEESRRAANGDWYRMVA